MPLLLILFIALPIAEIAVLIQAGSWIGLWPTLGLIVLTAVIGTFLLRMQGLSVLRQAQKRADRGEPPLREMADAIGLIVAAAFLLTPGFITDAVGFALLMPPVRSAIMRYATRNMRIITTVATSTTRTDATPNDAAYGPGPRADGKTIDTSYEEIDPETGHPTQPPNDR